jgi:WD40 repeat protein
VQSFSVDAFGNVAYVNGDNQVHLFDTRTGDDFLVPVASRGLDAVGNVSLSGDGRFVSYSGLSNGLSNIYLTDLGTGQQLTYPFLPSGGAHLLQNLELSNAGDSLLYSDNGQVRALDLRTGFTDNLPLINNNWAPTDAAFLAGNPGQIVFNNNGQVGIYNRYNATIDTLPILNNLFPSANLLADGHSSFTPLF